MVWLVMAAGQSKRFGGGKLLSIVNNKPMIDGCLDALTATSSPVLSVVRRGDLNLQRHLLQRHTPFTVCDDAHFGMAHSLSWGVTLVRHSAPWVGIVLADMPFVEKNTFLALASAAKAVHIVVPTCAGEVGHPVIFGSDFFTELMNLKGDRGAKYLLKRHAEKVRYMSTRDSGILMDIDTQEAARAFEY